MTLDALRELATSSLQADSPFGARTTYRVGGTARHVLRVESRGQLALWGDALRDIENIYVLGNGSNTLVSDEGFDGLVIVLGEEFSQLTVADGGRVTAGAALDLPVVARRSVEAGLRGFEWAVGVPGTIGGAVTMNAGGHGSDMAASVVSVDIWDVASASVLHQSRDDLRFSYRRSAITSRQIVLSATLQLTAGDSDEGREVMREIVRWRREHQPGGANAGSVFQNPPASSAGQLIDECGLKGRRHGSAHVSEKHANFIQVDADGRADDVADLMTLVHDTVLVERGVDLHTEIRLVGFSQ